MAQQKTTVESLEDDLKKVTIYREVTIPQNRTYGFVLSSPYTFDISTLQHQLSSGSLSLKVQVDGVDVTGLTSLSPGVSTAVATATGANSVTAGDPITFVVSSASSPGVLFLQLNGTLT